MLGVHTIYGDRWLTLGEEQTREGNSVGQLYQVSYRFLPRMQVPAYKYVSNLISTRREMVVFTNVHPNAINFLLVLIGLALSLNLNALQAIQSNIQL